ncbi:MAG: hypothetical protein E7314_05235 [Clostridiales bacterium]|nr:hypothetical protein [Clostridiales bacterium]
MILKFNNFYITISPYIFLSIFILLLKCKLANLFLCFLALTIHELGHIITTYILREKISILKILPFGFSCKLKNQSQIQKNKMLKILIAGPAVNFVAAGLIFYWTQEFATINFLIGIFNLLPIFELDGMRIVSILINCRGRHS